MIVLMVILTTSAPLILPQLKLLHIVDLIVVGVGRAVGVSFLARFAKSDSDRYCLKYGESVSNKDIAILVSIARECSY